jgi:HEAT repeat protein
LREAARQPVDPPLAVPAIVALGRIAATGGSSVAAQAVSTLLDLATHGDWRDPVLRTASAWSPELLNWITGWLPHQPVPIRRVAVDALSRMQHPGASDVIAGRLHDEDATVRTAAISAVGRLGSLGAAASAIALATADPDPGVRRRAASACRRHGWPTDASIA